MRIVQFGSFWGMKKRLAFWSILSVVVLPLLCGSLTPAAWGQAALTAPDTDSSVAPAKPEPADGGPDRALVFEGMYSFGNYNLFASGSGTKIWTSGVEYDRHSWGRLFKARMDYVAEILPFMLLEGPTETNRHGYPLTTARRLVPGVGFSPIGFRLLWREGRLIQPYMDEKGGMDVFTHKVLNNNASYENFTLQSSTGVLLKTQSRFQVRVSLYSDFHMSNAFIVPLNPGIDMMNATLGLSYDIGRGRPWE